ncbi:MAG: nucleoside triphosphate pyrophosphohydrolase [Actinomycetota bacterium]
MTGRIVVVGLGPGGDEFVTSDTRRVIERIPTRYVRTAVHPTAHVVTDHGGAIPFDDVYDQADTFDDVYATIVERLLEAAAEEPEVLYAVPGSPLVLERTVRLLQAAADGGAVHVEIHPAMSFLDLAWARLGIDPVETGVRLIDGHEFATAAAGERGPLLVAHTHADWVLSDIKLSVDDPPDDPVATILKGLGTPDEAVIDVRWDDLDRTVAADHLTSVWIPELAAPVGAPYVRFHQLARTLREECPWDIEQTHTSLIPYLLEETYEVVDALQALDPADPATDEHLIEELGDLLYQIEFHATIAEQEGRFTIADVADGIHDKLVRRHPHVFPPVDGEVVDVDGDVDAVLSNWDDIKRAEKGRTSVFDGIARSMPALAYAAKVGKKASKVGFDWPDVGGAFAKIDEERHELAEAMAIGDDDTRAERSDAELGDLLFATVNVARHLGIDPELALRRATDTFRQRFEHVERLAAAEGVDLKAADLATLDRLWDAAKTL